MQCSSYKISKDEATFLVEELNAILEPSEFPIDKFLEDCPQLYNAPLGHQRVDKNTFRQYLGFALRPFCQEVRGWLEQELEVDSAIFVEGIKNDDKTKPDIAKHIAHRHTRLFVQIGINTDDLLKAMRSDFLRAWHTMHVSNKERQQQRQEASLREQRKAQEAALQEQRDMERTVLTLSTITMALSMAALLFSALSK